MCIQASLLRMKTEAHYVNAFFSQISVPSTLIFWKRSFFLSDLAFRPYIDGEFEKQKRRFSKTVAKVDFFENAGLSNSFKRKEKSFSISIVLAFFIYRGGKRIRIRHKCMTMLLKTEKRLIPVFKNIRKRVEICPTTLRHVASSVAKIEVSRFY